MLHKKISSVIAEKLVIFLSTELLHRQGTPVGDLIKEAIDELNKNQTPPQD